MVGDDGSCVCRLRLESGPTQLGQGAAEACVVWVCTCVLGYRDKRREEDRPREGSV